MEENVFINFTNHPSELWSIEQRSAAEEYGDIIDIPFPPVDPSLSSEAVSLLATEYIGKIEDHHPRAVLCQGEYTLCFRVVADLKNKGITVLAACSKRDVIDNNGDKITRFTFEHFREY